MDNSQLGVLVIIVLILFVIFLILRELNCWYFKINARYELQKEILDQLKIISTNLKAPIVIDRPAPESTQKVAEDMQEVPRTTLTENKVVDMIHESFRKRNFDKCKMYCMELIRDYPNSEYVDFANTRLQQLDDIMEG